MAGFGRALNLSFCPHVRQWQPKLPAAQKTAGGVDGGLIARQYPNLYRLGLLNNAGVPTPLAIAAVLIELRTVSSSAARLSDVKGQLTGRENVLWQRIKENAVAAFDAALRREVRRCMASLGQSDDLDDRLLCIDHCVELEELASGEKNIRDVVSELDLTIQMEQAVRERLVVVPDGCFKNAAAEYDALMELLMPLMQKAMESVVDRAHELTRGG
jgi:hypothetical protein